MTSAPEPDAVPGPRRPPRGLQPPESAASGRILFFVLGIATAVFTGVVFGVLSGSHIQPDPGPVALLIPATALGYVVWKRVREGRRWRWLSYAVGAVSLPACFLTLVFFGPAIHDWWKSTDFDAEAWRADATTHEGRRVWMVDDLLAQDRLVGRKIAEVDTLLGMDDGAHGTNWGAGYFTDNDRIWHLGPERGFISIDSEWLVLRVGNDDTVTEARIVRD